MGETVISKKMMTMTLKISPFTIAMVLFLHSIAQPNPITNLQPLGPVSHHYLDLQQLSSKPREAFSHMDKIAYPPAMYRSNTMLFALMTPAYLTSDQVDFLVSAVSFPANSSEQTRAELDYLLQLQRERTPDQVQRVMEIARVGYWPDAGMLPTHPRYDDNLQSLFFEVREVMGSGYKANQYPATTHLLKKAMVDMRLMEFAVKYHLLRARPYQLEPKLSPLREISSPSFASGHTLWAYVQALLFAELIPEKRTAFLDLAYEIGVSREIMGVHYPSDEETARQLAHRMVMLMWNTMSFQSDFIKAKEEWD